MFQAEHVADFVNRFLNDSALKQCMVVAVRFEAVRGDYCCAAGTSGFAEDKIHARDIQVESCDSQYAVHSISSRALLKFYQDPSGMVLVSRRVESHCRVIDRVKPLYLVALELEGKFCS